MSVNKELVKGSTSMLVLGVLEEKEMYGYQIIKELEQRSETVFSLKEGTLYPILHVLEQDGFLDAYFSFNSSSSTTSPFTVSTSSILPGRRRSFLIT